MPTFTIDENAPILIEIKPAAGTVMRTALTPQDIAAQSEKALQSAMNAIHAMARRVNDTISQIKLAERPSTVEVDFALKVTAEASAIIAQTGTEASFNVKLTWVRLPEKPALPAMD
jgi:hypothetical protein